MENASKALIIAGAILLSILIISLGIVVVNNTRTTIDKANVNQQEVQTFNSKFEAYVGNNKTASDVRALVSTVNASNGAEATNLTNHFVTKGDNTTDTQTTKPTVQMPTDLSAGTKYTISVYYDSTNGYVKAVNWE